MRVAADEGCDLVVVGPEAPLVDGVIDALGEKGITGFGPTAAAARLEGSKAFAKELMKDVGVPTAAHVVVQDAPGGGGAPREQPTTPWCSRRTCSPRARA